MQVILIGKGRRITLDELSNLSRGNAKLEMQGDDTTTDTAESGTDDALLSAALDKLSLNGGDGSNQEMLSSGATIASLSLLALTLVHGRVVRGECATQVASSLVDIVNTIISQETVDGSNSKKVTLSTNSTEFAKGVNLLIANEELKGIIEDKSYLVRLISLARVSLMLSQGKILVSLRKYYVISF